MDEIFKLFKTITGDDKQKKVVSSFPIKPNWAKLHKVLTDTSKEVSRLQSKREELHKLFWSTIRLESGNESAEHLRYNEAKNVIEVLEEEKGIISPFVPK